MEYFAPHPSAVFEGYYSKFNLPSGASLILIVCSVPKAERKPHMVSLSYIPAEEDKEVYQQELWVDQIHRVTTGPNHAFELRVPGVGSVRCDADSTTHYDLDHEFFSFHAVTKARTPWSPSSSASTPEGLLVYLPLPLHWHVHSLASTCDYSLRLPPIPPEDSHGTAILHQEKNWANSFPSSHIWIQARGADSRSSFCCAGGHVLGMQAYLLGYRGKDNSLAVDFSPPFALQVLGFSPFMSVNVDWQARTVFLSLMGWKRKIVIRASAPRGSFFGLSSPFADGHRENFLGQSMRARVEVEVAERGWLEWVMGKSWRILTTQKFEGAALEFGGGFYEPRGTEQRKN